MCIHKYYCWTVGTFTFPTDWMETVARIVSSTVLSISLLIGGEGACWQMGESVSEQNQNPEFCKTYFFKLYLVDMHLNCVYLCISEIYFLNSIHSCFPFLVCLCVFTWLWMWNIPKKCVYYAPVTNKYDHTHTHNLLGIWPFKQSLGPVGNYSGSHVTQLNIPRALAINSIEKSSNQHYG